MSAFSRRHFMASASAAGMIGAAAFSPLSAINAAAQPSPIVLRAVKRGIEIKGKAATVYDLVQRNGMSGLVVPAGRFRVHLENEIGEPTLIHWHGLLPPYGQDGVPDLPQPLLASGRSYDYDFPLSTPGTHWMHAHTLQEQQLLAAPLIVVDPEENTRNEQPIAVLFHDFSFKSPAELLAGLATGSAAAAHGGLVPIAGSAMPSHAMVGHMMPAHTLQDTAAPGILMDVNDIEYDAYLANDRTLDDPQVFRVESGATVRLRLINGATATAFWIDLGALPGEALAVDGSPVVPISGRRFPLGMGQRLDIRVDVPKTEGSWPILALREDAEERTGFILATKAGRVERIPSVADQPSEPLTTVFEEGLRALRPLPTKLPDQQATLVLGGDMAPYVWTLNGREWGKHRSLSVRMGARVELTLHNQSMMSHPMHLHGHHFQVAAIDGRPMAGAVRDTIWVPPRRTITLAFDAKNPGTWAIHCHQLYHMATGMMTTIEYQT